MKLRTLLAATALVAIPTLAATPVASAEKAQVYTPRKNNVAVQGYDPVAYFKVGAPVEGLEEFSTMYHGAEFRFSSAENLAAFEADPAKYAPQYGGYCAWAVAQGKTAKGDKDNWSIVDGKLYLNYNNGIQKKWEKDRDAFIQSADENWPEVLK